MISPSHMRATCYNYASMEVIIYKLCDPYLIAHNQSGSSTSLRSGRVIDGGPYIEFMLYAYVDMKPACCQSPFSLFSIQVIT